MGFRGSALVHLLAVENRSVFIWYLSSRVLIMKITVWAIARRTSPASIANCTESVFHIYEWIVQDSMAALLTSEFDPPDVQHGGCKFPVDVSRNYGFWFNLLMLLVVCGRLGVVLVMFLKKGICVFAGAIAASRRTGFTYHFFFEEYVPITWMPSCLLIWSALNLGRPAFVPPNIGWDDDTFNKIQFKRSLSSMVQTSNAVFATEIFTAIVLQRHGGRELENYVEKHHVATLIRLRNEAADKVIKKDEKARAAENLLSDEESDEDSDEHSDKEEPSMLR